MQHRETYRATMNGQQVDLHRCRECTRAFWYATGKPADDNGFVRVDRPVKHAAGCPDKGAY